MDSCILEPEAAKVRAAAARVAADLDLPSDWLNDAAKGYIVNYVPGKLLLDRPSLVIRIPKAEQLLAMKLAAWRDQIDRDDAELLLKELAGSKEEIWARVEPFVPPEGSHKVCYAFEDLWDAVHGTAPPG